MRQQNNMDKMQQEAVRRMQEMQSRAKYPQSTHKKAPVPPSSHQKQTPKEEVCEAAEVSENTDTLCKKEKNDIISQLFQDNELSLILLLIVILGSEKADTGLILALLYLVL